MIEAAYEALLKKAGYRATKPRRAVVSALACGDGHVEPESLWKAGRERYPRLGRATVYRTLEVLTSLGVLRPVVSGNGGHVYAVAGEGHHHLVCSNCGRMVDFDSGGPCDGWQRVARRHGFTLSGHLLELYGLCGECRANG